MPQLKAVIILAIFSGIATLCYLSLWSNLDYDSDDSVFNNLRKVANRYRPIDDQGQPTPLQQQQQQQEQQSGPTISQHNARLAAQNNKAFVSFCSGLEADREAATAVVLNDSPDTAFTSYAQWIQHIDAKNSRQQPQEQTQEQGQDVGLPQNQSSEQEKPLLYLERPLENWVVNLTATSEPCNRLIHSSAHCLEYLTREHKYLVPATPQLKEQKSTTMDFHIFWRGPISDKLSLSAHAFLFTQPLQRSHLHLWIDSADLPNGEPEDYTQNPFSAPLVSPPLNKHISIHAWDQEAELAYAYPGQGTTDEDKELREMEQKLQQSKPVKPVALSDEARFLILNRNGGMYLDADVLLLKDMSPFYDSGLEFAYEWSMTRMYNTAILRLYKQSTVARRILDGARARETVILKKKLELLKQQIGQQEASKHEHQQLRRRQQLEKRGEMRPEEIYHPARLRKYLRPQDAKIEGNGLIMMPPAFFDPLWLRVDHAEAKDNTDPEKMLEDLKSFPDAFSVESSAGPEVFFQGAYAYHWHNNWATPIEPQSWMGHMQQAYHDFVAGRRPNLYGEWF
ncbi:hypothetical protein BGZ94_000026 [Podila epigama]|nr:hypothetical protein BGZ94_000026 [Podila epigama]